jgi:hypothetical protein
MQTASLLQSALSLLDAGNLPAGEFRAAARRVLKGEWSLLVSGLCSVGKSSFVSALWGDSELLPTAVRDCTQTNTIVRVPHAEELGHNGVFPAQPGGSQRAGDRRILLSYLSRDEALDFATRGLAYHRLAEMLREILGPAAGQLDEGLPEARLRRVVELTRKQFAEHPEFLVLHEPLTDEVEQLEEFLSFLDTPRFQPGKKVEAEWADRREHLMGRRRPDGRALDVGRLLALRHVEMLRHTDCWPAPAPVLIDTPWIPAFHNARRAELILADARQADMLILLALPQRFEPEDWVLRALRERPELARRALVFFNQIDTIDQTVLFGRDGFAAAFQENVERLCKLGFSEKNFFCGCARLPFLERAKQDGYVAERAQKLRRVLERITKLADGRPASDFKTRLLQACDPNDCGIETLRQHACALYSQTIQKTHAAAALNSLQKISPAELPAALAAQWGALREQAQF